MTAAVDAGNGADVRLSHLVHQAAVGADEQGGLVPSRERERRTECTAMGSDQLEKGSWYSTFPPEGDLSTSRTRSNTHYNG